MPHKPRTRGPLRRVPQDGWGSGVRGEPVEDQGCVGVGRRERERPWLRPRGKDRRFVRAPGAGQAHGPAAVDTASACASVLGALRPVVYWVGPLLCV